jgi:hypothetical protein
VNEQIKDYCHSKVDQRIFENWLKDELESRFNSLTTIFHTKEDHRIFETKVEDRFLQVIEMIKTQSLAINELSKKMDQINEKHSLS